MNAFGRRRNTPQFEPAQALIVGSHVALADEQVDFYPSLIVGDGSEDRGVPRGCSPVPQDDRRERAACRLDSDGTWAELRCWLIAVLSRRLDPASTFSLLILP